MVRFMLIVGCLLGLTLGANSAFAEDEGEVQEIEGKRVRVKFKKKEVIDFEDVLIQGELKKPQGAYLLNRKKSDFSDMIQERAHFKRELVDALDRI